jgi:prevent-host-death family protein
MSTITLENAKKDLDRLLDEAVHSIEPVIIRREGKPDVALVPVADLKVRRRKSHSEHLYSPANMRRMDAAIADLDAGRGVYFDSIEDVQKYVAEEVVRRKSAKFAVK